MTDSITLNSGSGGSELSVNDLAGGEVCQNVKLLSAEDASEVQIYAGSGVAANAIRVTNATDTPIILGASAGTNIGSAVLLAGTAAIGVVESAGSVSHDAVGTAIKPTLDGSIAQNMDSTAVGFVAEGDISYSKCDTTGRKLVTTMHPNHWSANVSTSTAATVEMQAAPAAGLFLYITDVVITSLTAQTTKIVSATGAPVVEIPIIYTGANGNSNMHFQTPIKVAAAATNLGYIISASVATSIVVNGFTAP